MRRNIFQFILLLSLALGSGACSVIPSASARPVESAPTFAPTATCTLTTVPTSMKTPTPADPPAAASTGASADPTATFSPAQDRIPPEQWQDWPVIPAISAHAASILNQGIELGNRANAFSKIGDCETITEWFLGDFDKGPDHYNLGPYGSLSTVIASYQGSYGRVGVAAKRGFTAASVLNPYWRDVDQCGKTETPLDCEIRLNQPAFALIMVGTNDVSRPETFERNLRAVIDETLAKHVLPVLMTKADNREGDNSLNLTTARLAYEYDIPLWNFWRAVQDLPDHGLAADGSHLTFAPNDFSSADAMQHAWPVRNLTALQVLDALRAATHSWTPAP